MHIVKKIEPMLMDEKLETWFGYHRPTNEQREQYELIRRVGFLFARVILENTPASTDQAAALRKVREALMTANAAIACQGI